jgi:iron complex outermembrane recepter protein
MAKTHTRQPARTLRATPVAVACATLLLPAAGAWAQAADQTVVITGIRHAIETSIAVKRNSDSIVEAITAEDLGKLPDNSIAESLARLPGVTAQRLSGRASSISLRGMSPKWAVTLLNGREVVSTGDGRSVELDQFPAELINGATVYKTPDASLGTQGLSGTINMLTVRPLDMSGRQVAVNARAEKNSNSEQIPGFSSTGNRFSVSYVDQFADRTVGLALGYAHLDSPEQQQHYSNWWWTNMANYPGGWCGGTCATPGVDADAVALQGFEATAFASKQVRDGLVAVLEFKPNKNVRTTLDLFYSKFSKKFQGREFQEDGFNTWSGTTITNAVYDNWDGEKVLVGGTATGLSAKMLTRNNKRDDKTTAIGLNNEMRLGSWTTNADLSYSKVKRDEFTAEAYAFPSNTGSLTFRINREGPSQFTPSLNWADPNIMQLQQAWGQWVSKRDFTVEDELKGFKLSGKTDLSWGPINRVEAGLHYTQRSKEYQQVKTAYDRRDGLTTGLPFPAGMLQAPATLGFGSIPAIVNFDVQDVLNTGLFVGRQDDINSIPNRTWGVTEKVTMAFVKAGLEFKLGGLDVRGNTGLQLVRTNQEGRGVALQAGNVITPISGKHSYTDALPSLNLAAEVFSNAMLRFGLARQMVRPNMEDMRAGIGNISRSNTNLGLWSANGGNYTLEPWRADAADLSFEYYLNKRSYVAAAAFYKQVKTTIYNGTVVTNFPSYLTDPCVPQTGGTCPSNPDRIGTINAKFNGDGGWVRGTEFTAALDFGRFVPALDGFGVISSVSFTKSDIHELNNLSNPLEGMSGTVGSIVAYYEKNGFQSRVAQRTRSRYLAAVRNIWGDSTLTTIEPERIVDFQVGYSFEQGPLKGVSVLFQINNATNEPYKTKMGASDGTGAVPNASYLGVYDRYGRQYLLGVGYKF